MKIMKVVDKKIGDITYYKYRVNLPKEIAEKSGFLEKEIKVSLKNDKIIVEKV